MADYISINDLAAILGPDITGDEDFLITKNNVSYKITLKELDAYLRIHEDARLSKSENLNDLENKETARLNLGVYSKEETDENILQSIEDYTVPLGGGTSGDYIKNILAGDGINILNGTGEGSDTTISISNIGTAGTYTKVITNEKGQVVGNELLVPNDIPNLDASKITSGIISAERLPSFVDDVLEFLTYDELPMYGETGKIYVVVNDETSNGDTSTYRWTGTVYAMVSNTLNTSDVKALYEANPNTNAYTDAEKSKLADIEDSATADQTAPEILTLLKTVDGSGSELDADLLDGQEGAYYLDASNINAGTIDDDRLPDTITSDITGNAATASKLYNAMNIALTGDVTGDVNFDGSANVSITTTVADDSHNHIISNVDGLQDALDSKANQSDTYTKTEVDGRIGTLDSTAVKLTGDQTIAGIKTFSSDIIGNVTGNSGTSTKLETPRTINGVAFDGSADIEIVSRMGSVATAAADVTNIGTAGTKETVHISGNTAITSLGTGTTGMVRTVIFDSALTLTHNFSKIIFPSAGTITTAPGDIFVFLCEDGTNGIWRCISTFPSRIW